MGEQRFPTNREEWLLGEWPESARLAGEQH
jgi:hypothetical protein